MEPINIRDSIKANPKEIQGSGKYVVVELTGYLDTYNSRPFQDYIESIIAEGYKFIIMDCTGLNYVSSTGIGSFTSFSKSLNAKSGEMIMVNLIPKVLEVFKLLGFSNFFKILTNVEAAVEVLNQKVATGGGGNGSADAGASDGAGGFPAVVACPNCSKKLKVPKSGKFRCSSCKSIIAVSDSVEVSLA